MTVVVAIVAGLCVASLTACVWLADGIPVIRSWRHHDGEECSGGGWFTVTAQLPTVQVSNHYPSDPCHLCKEMTDA